MVSIVHCTVPATAYPALIRTSDSVVLVALQRPLHVTLQPDGRFTNTCTVCARHTCVSCSYQQ